jgi:hypothetical protein
MVAINILAVALSLSVLTQAAPAPFPNTSVALRVAALDNSAARHSFQVRGNNKGNNGNGKGNGGNKNANWVDALNAILGNLGLSCSNDAGKHGNYWSINYGFNRGAKKAKKSHPVPWKNNNFVGWNTYKANGVNLGE